MAANSLHIDPVSDEDAQEIRELYEALRDKKTAALVGPDNTKLELPPALYDLLVAILRDMQEGKPIQLMHVNEQMSTQAAADYLGVSRQFFVGELQAGKIKHHLVGKHRRVNFQDLMEYDKQRRQDRKAAIQNLARQSQELGIYDEFISMDGE